MTRWLPLGEAAEALGVGRESLRARRRRGGHEARFESGIYYYAVPDEDAPKRNTVPASAPRGGTYRVLSLFDVHVPDADAWALKAVLDFARDIKPDHVVIGGDFLELESCSQHGGVANPQALVDEIKAGRKALERIRKACPDAKLVYLEGNHETRLGRVVAGTLPTFDGALDLPSLLELDEMRCEWVPYRRLWRPFPGAQLAYTHGDWSPLHHAKRHADGYGVSVRYGHTHRPQTYARSYGDGRVLQGIGTGCLRTLDPSWAGPHHGWTHGFGLDEFAGDGSFTSHNIVMTGRRFCWDGRLYGASRI